MLATITDSSLAQEFMKFSDENHNYIGPAAVVVHLPNAGLHLISLFNNGPWMASTQKFLQIYVSWLVDGVYVVQQYPEDLCNYDAELSTSCNNGRTVIGLSSAETCSLRVYGTGM